MLNYGVIESTHDIKHAYNSNSHPKKNLTKLWLDLQDTTCVHLLLARLEWFKRKNNCNEHVPWIWEGGVNLCIRYTHTLVKAWLTSMSEYESKTACKSNPKSVEKKLPDMRVTYSNIGPTRDPHKHTCFLVGSSIFRKFCDCASRAWRSICFWAPKVATKKTFYHLALGAILKTEPPPPSPS